MSTHSTGTFGSTASGDNSTRKRRGERKKKNKNAATTTNTNTTNCNSMSSENGLFSTHESGHSRGSQQSHESSGSRHNDERRSKDQAVRRGTRPGKEKQNNNTNSSSTQNARPRARTRSPKGRPKDNTTNNNNNNPESSRSNQSSNTNSNNKKEGKPLKHKTTTNGGAFGNPSFSSDGTFSTVEQGADIPGYEFESAPNSDTEVKSVVSKNFDDVYQRGRRLGLGAFAVVFIGTHRPTGAEYAVKQIDRSTMFWGDRDALQDEIVNLKMARAGPNIVQLYEVYEEKAFCYLIMEVMEGGELLECIIEKKTTFTEKEARSAVRCVLRALAYLHSNRVAHRDIKPENLLLSDPYQKDLNSVKLADFSFARQVQKRNDCRTLCGTPGYLSPEMLEKFPAYDVKCDVWSVGCLLFLLLGGFLPFDDEDDEVVFDLTRQGRFEFRPEFWNSVSQSAKDLVTKMLTVNPKKRISASRALQSHWIEHGDEEFEERQLNVKKVTNLIEGKRKLKSAITTLITANRVKMLNNDFKEYLEKRKEENLANKLSTKKTRNTKHDFVEDSVSGKPFEDFYEIGDELGEGGYAFVYRCHHKQTEKVYAVKEVIISKMESGGESTLKDEIAALKLLRGGAHIIRLYDVFYEGDHCFMIMEEMRGGDLLSRICDKEVYTEREARGVCKILFEAVLYCHQKRVAHRDIKPENLLMVETDDDTSIKLADFGFAKRVVSDLSLSTLCGTAQYVAPEILDFQIDGYDERCDMWSVGVVTYILLGGYAPFEGEPDELAQFIIRGEYEFHDKYWADISESAKDMIHNMLQVNPAVRLTAIEALSCEWMGLSPEELAGKDLGGAREQMEEQLKLEENAASLEAATDDAISRGKKSKKSIAGKKALQALIQTNKFLSLGAMVGGQTSKDPTSDPDKLGFEEAAEDDFEDCYDWGRQIGVGTFSVIHEAVQEKAGELYAVKRIPRVDLWEEDAVALQNEIMCLKLISDCDCIVQLTEVFDETDFTYIVMEILPGGYLIDKIIEKHFYDEAKGLIIAKRLITAVEYCHYNCIAIRDLRPENMLLAEGSDTEVKLSDFGHAKIVLQPNSLTTVCGTEAFVAPEIIEHSPQYDVECDIWSLGVVLYILLGGYRPFRGEGDACLEKIRYGDYKFHKKYWSHISSDTKDLISRMLTVDVQRRITAQEALDCDLIRTTPNKERRKKGRKKSSSSEARRPKSNHHVDKWK